MDIVIIGNGIAGITAARNIRKRSDHRIHVVSSESEHFYSRTALMYIYMGQMKYEHTKPYEDWFWKKNDINLIFDHAETISLVEKRIMLRAGNALNYDKLIIATGSVSNFLDWPGVKLNGVQGLYSLQDLESMEKNSKGISHATVVGGGLIGVEMAEMLHSRGISVTFLVRETNFWDIVLPREEATMLDRHIRSRGIDLKLETELSIIEGSDAVEAVLTSDGEKINTQFVGITIGVSPNKQLASDSGLETEKGILVDDYLRTSNTDVFAIGDCVQMRNPMQHRKPTEAVWYVGRMMGETVAATICGDNTEYRPGNWYNSAKFFDLEYQVYGYVPNEPDAISSSFYWEDGERCIRLVFDKYEHTLLGINSLGIRLRHEIADVWLTSKIKVNEAVSKLPELNFDPEFSREFAEPVIDAFKAKFPNLPVRKEVKSVLKRIFG